MGGERQKTLVLRAGPERASEMRRTEVKSGKKGADIKQQEHPAQPVRGILLFRLAPSPSARRNIAALVRDQGSLDSLPAPNPRCSRVEPASSRSASRGLSSSHIPCRWNCVAQALCCAPAACLSPPDSTEISSRRPLTTDPDPRQPTARYSVAAVQARAAPATGHNGAPSLSSVLPSQHQLRPINCR